MNAPATALLVEDCAALRMLTTATLRQLGMEVTALPGGEGVVEVAREIRPRVIVLDLMLPDVCGLEVCEALRACEETADIPILVISARSTPQDRAFAEIAGADDYLVKPITPTALAERVRRLLLLVGTHL
jgi:DNA-binding response OmpR family regulator